VVTTPDRKPGTGVEEELLLQDEYGVDPTVAGAMRYVSGSFRFRDGSGVFDPRAGSGDVTGPVSSLDNQIARFHLTTGKVIQAGTNAPTYDDSGNIILADREIIGCRTHTYNGTTPYIQSGVTGAATVDWNNGQKQEIIFGAGNITTLAFTNITAGGPCNLILLLTQDGTGSRIISTSWDADIRWTGVTIPTLTTTANRTDLFAFFYTGSALHLYLGGMTPNYDLT